MRGFTLLHVDSLAHELAGLRRKCLKQLWRADDHARQQPFRRGSKDEASLADRAWFIVSDRILATVAACFIVIGDPKTPTSHCRLHTTGQTRSDQVHSVRRKGPRVGVEVIGATCALVAVFTSVLFKYSSIFGDEFRWGQRDRRESVEDKVIKIPRRNENDDNMGEGQVDPTDRLPADKVFIAQVSFFL